MEPYEREALRAVTERPTPVYRTLRAQRISPVLGVEISGVDLSKHVPEQQLVDVRAAFRDHHLIVIRQQKITGEDHDRFTTALASLSPINPPSAAGSLTLRGRTDLRSATADRTAGSRHRDTESAWGSTLYNPRTPGPEFGGETLFVNMHLAHDMLSPTMRSLLEQLTAIHDDAQALAHSTPPPDYVIPKSEQPLIARHPETHRKLLNVNEAYTTRVPQLAARESRALLNMLFDTIAHRAILHCRVRWTPDTLVLWDNRCVQRHATYGHPPHLRNVRHAIIGSPAKA
ncbi:TauD/TfdA dioxygenase family protein [Streptomyces fructofermentans]|uniref:TauD/TfdA dioxygenase family protein n=1 Tax=Streptomyces fructofermentans TaxID=152141 RepID=UPI00340BC972